MRPGLLSTLFLALVVPFAAAVDPPAPQPVPTIDELLAKLDASSKKKADADKEIAALKVALKKQYADWTAKLKKAGVLDPTPPTPPKPPPVPPKPPEPPTPPAPIPEAGF